MRGCVCMCAYAYVSAHMSVCVCGIHICVGHTYVQVKVQWHWFDPIKAKPKARHRPCLSLWLALGPQHMCAAHMSGREQPMTFGHVQVAKSETFENLGLPHTNLVQSTKLALIGGAMAEGHWMASLGWAKEEWLGRRRPFRGGWVLNYGLLAYGSKPLI